MGYASDTAGGRVFRAFVKHGEVTVEEAEGNGPPTVLLQVTRDEWQAMTQAVYHAEQREKRGSSY